jgi:radical SAM protein with 4Fe4S-binding SPASM domain
MIRLNIPNNDVKEAIAIADYLLTERKLLGKCYVKFAYLCDYSLSSDAARKAYINYVQNYSQWADYIFDRYGSSQIASPERILKHCYRASMSRFCIGSNGELYKCLHSAGDETKIMGNVWQGRFFNDAESMFYSPADIPSKSKCSNCEYLPVCMGECVKDCLMGFVRNDCESDKKLWLKLKLLEGGVRI